MRLAAVALIALSPMMAPLALAQSGLSEPSDKMTAIALYRLCSVDSKACWDYMDQARRWVKAHPDVYGPICEAAEVWSDERGSEFEGTPPARMGAMYNRVGNQAWLRQANAHDAAIWIVQGSLECSMQRIAAPGDAGFPTKMVDKSPKFHH